MALLEKLLRVPSKLLLIFVQKCRSRERNHHRRWQHQIGHHRVQCQSPGIQLLLAAVCLKVFTEQIQQTILRRIPKAKALQLQ